MFYACEQLNFESATLLLKNHYVNVEIPHNVILFLFLNTYIYVILFIKK